VPDLRIDTERVKPLHTRDFPHRLVVVTMDSLWTTREAHATIPVAPAEDYRGYIRISDGADFRYAFVGGRQHWIDEDRPVAAGILYEVSANLRGGPQSFPSDGARFREIGEAAVANDSALFETLRAAYAR